MSLDMTCRLEADVTQSTNDMPQKPLPTTQLHCLMISSTQEWTTLLPFTYIRAVSPTSYPYCLANGSAEIQQAARMLFDSALDRMSEEELQHLVEKHHPYREHIVHRVKLSAHHQCILGKRAKRK